jgi:hypothetical protein
MMHGQQNIISLRLFIYLLIFFYQVFKPNFMLIDAMYATFATHTFFSD